MRYPRFTRIFFVFLTGLFLTFGVHAVENDGAYSLSVFSAPASAGNVSVQIDGVPAAGIVNVPSGKTVAISATANPGYQFDFWEAEGVDIADRNAKDLAFPMPEEEVKLRAVFTEKKETYTVFVEENSMGFSNFLHKPIKPGETVSVDATPRDGFRFVRWHDEAGLGLSPEQLQNPILNFVMPETDVNLSMEFEPIIYRFTVNVVGKGKVEVEGKKPDASGVYRCTIDEEIALTATAENEFAFVLWSGNNGATFSDATQSTSTVLCPASDFTITAQFASTIKDLTLVAGEGGSISPEEGTLRFGVDCVFDLLAIPDPGYVFSHWESSSAKGKFEDEKKASTTFVMPDENCTVTAVFEKGGYRLSLFASPGGKVSGQEGSYEMGAEIGISAQALEGYVFSHWEGSVPGVFENAESPETKVTMPAKDLKVTAVFVLEATLSPRNPADPSGTASHFPWGIMIAIFIVSALAIALIIIREQFNLSYRYLIKKAFRNITDIIKKKK